MRVKRFRRFFLILTLTAVLSVLAVFLYASLSLRENGAGRFGALLSRPEIARLVRAEVPDYVDVQLIGVDGEARRGVPLEDITGIVVHYVGNPGTSAQGNRDYFDTPGTLVSAHFVIGLEGEVIQCVPLWEKSSASNERNRDTISIECCHPDEDGKFTEVTYASLVKLTAWLCELNELTAEQVIRHYDVTEKLCPLYFVEHEDAWEQFRQDVEKMIGNP